MVQDAFQVRRKAVSLADMLTRNIGCRSIEEVLAGRDSAHELAVNTLPLPGDSDAEQAGWAEKVNGSQPAGAILGPGLHAMDRDEPEDRVGAACGDRPMPGSPQSRLPTTRATCSGSTRTSAAATSQPVQAALTEYRQPLVTNSAGT